MPTRLLIAFFVLSANLTFSQKHFIGLRSGLAFTNAKNDLFEDPDRQTGLNAGITYDYFLTDNVSLGAELTFSQRGFKHSFYWNDEQDVIIEKTSYGFNYNYLAIPLQVRYSGNSKFYGFASGGLIPAFIVHATHDIPPVGGFEGGKVEVTRVTKFDLAGMLELGAGYKIQDRYRVFVSVAGQFSFNKFTNDNYFATANAHHYGYALSAGLKYALGKK